MKQRPSIQYTVGELQELGVQLVDDNVWVDRTCRFFGADNIRLGSHVRIDAYSVLSAGAAGISIGNYVHLATGTTILGGGGVTIEDFCGLSARVCIFSANDDYSQGAMTNPMIPDAFRQVKIAPVTLRRHAIIGCGSVIMPGLTVGVGASVGALSFVNKSVPDFMIVSGNPIKKVGMRSRQLLANEAMFLRENP